jgi:Flp pilus assembly protein TadB
MSRGVVVVALVAGAGATLLLGQLRWFRRPALSERIIRYVPGPVPPRRPSTGFSAESFRDVIAPLVASVGDRLSRLFGVSDALAVRLVRIHAPLSTSDFRLRQLGVCIAALGTGLLAACALGRHPLVAFLFVVGGPLLAFLVLEQRVSAASARWQRRIFLELPTLAEQLAMLLGAGYSVGAALHRLAQRGSGCCAADLERVCARVRQGLSETEALTEWSDLAGVPALSRLVRVLALNRDAGDLSRLISEETRALRRDAQRELVEAIERRAQQVWIPVTVAALVPGVLLLVVPFVQALRLYTST